MYNIKTMIYVTMSSTRNNFDHLRTVVSLYIPLALALRSFYLLLRILSMWAHAQIVHCYAVANARCTVFLVTRFYYTRLLRDVFFTTTVATSNDSGRVDFVHH
jgi:hypothetical protein